MNSSEPTRPDLGKSDEILGLPRLVLETHLRLGPNSTPEQVADDIRESGIETTVEEVRSLWPEGGNLTG
ncbi:MAG: hypothetical protein JWO38_3451 [Gemmataceae bacterium]|nr:hypothetical protein [Gemmataceae bacterium]